MTNTEAEKTVEAKIETPKVTFRDLGLSEAMLKSIEKKGYVHPSPVQEWVIPLLLNGDKDIIGQAQTGTGKTASFGIPILERLDSSNKGIALSKSLELIELILSIKWKDM